MINAEPSILTISQLNAYIRSIIDGDLNLSSLFVIGEISNFTNHYRTGHYYLTLKDDKASIKAVMFKTANQRLKFMPENGMRVIVFGRISVFERDGQYQLYIEDMQPDGLGALNLAFEQLKEKLGKEGLFDIEKKKDIPSCPKRIGVITSPTGAAIRDIINVISRRYPLAELILYGVEVQGEKAVKGLTKAIREMDSLSCCDVIIIGRGGGSIEELWAFNDENLARAIYDCSTPVISAVGHETDYTICDFVADLRAPTPSAAAELAVPDKTEQIIYINGLKSVLTNSVKNKINDERKQLNDIISSRAFVDPKVKLDESKQYLDEMTTILKDKYSISIEREKSEFVNLFGRLDAMNPLKVLMRGYSIVSDENGKIINSVENINSGEELNIQFYNGNVKCSVIETEN